VDGTNRVAMGRRVQHRECNIGAYLGGIASMSLHGWVWGIMALLGTWIGLRARPIFGLSRPRPTDGGC